MILFVARVGGLRTRWSDNSEGGEVTRLNRGTNDLHELNGDCFLAVRAEAAATLMPATEAHLPVTSTPPSAGEAAGARASPRPTTSASRR